MFLIIVSNYSFYSINTYIFLQTFEDWIGNHCPRKRLNLPFKSLLTYKWTTATTKETTTTEKTTLTAQKMPTFIAVKRHATQCNDYLFLIVLDLLLCNVVFLLLLFDLIIYKNVLMFLLSLIAFTIFIFHHPSVFSLLCFCVFCLLVLTLS